MSADAVVLGETTGLILTFQALPLAGEGDSVNVQLRKLAQSEAGRETIRRFANRTVGAADGTANGTDLPR